MKRSCEGKRYQKTGDDEKSGVERSGGQYNGDELSGCNFFFFQN